MGVFNCEKSFTGEMELEKGFSVNNILQTSLLVSSKQPKPNGHRKIRMISKSSIKKLRSREISMEASPRK
jgi:hypothetical protein